MAIDARFDVSVYNSLVCCMKMLDSGISTLNQDTIHYMRRALMPEVTDIDAAAYFTRSALIYFRLFLICIFLLFQVHFL